MQIKGIYGSNSVEVARWLADFLSGYAPLSKGGGAICIPGGSTPFPILAALSGMGVAFEQVEVWPGDDRLVPEGHPASNVGRIRRLLEPMGAKVVGLEEGGLPPNFMITWLGMGDDGHIASLFPNTDPIPDDPLRVRYVAPDPLPPEAPFNRLSMTIPALLNCEELLFVMRGSKKRSLFEAALNGKYDLPISRLLAAARQPITYFVL